MKLVTYIDSFGADRVGALTQDMLQVVDLAASARQIGQPSHALGSMRSLIEAGDPGLALARAALAHGESTPGSNILKAAAGLQLKAPVPRPTAMRDFLSFERHVQGCRTTRFKHRTRGQPDADAQFDAFVQAGGLKLAPVWYEQPIYYKGNRMSVVGPHHDIQWPSYSNLLDFELEFGIFIGRSAKNVSRENAGAHIFGFSIFNDVSARDAQARESEGQLGPAKGKDFDTGNVIGPWLVTADEIADPYNLTMIARVNGEEWSRGNSREMAHRFEDMIAHVSMDETIYPGEFLGSGTVPGGCGLELDRWLQPGDVIELEVEGLGILRNRVVR
ncbi:MAG: fumarylacetoacetate hydrolase family protein [Ideonella sp.]